ncbi:MAG: chromate efflux transporter [Betaproteobacteria bacterium]|nr:MAG: chromate efflux transporter [Betaproteobacteria bacterium]
MGANEENNKGEIKKELTLAPVSLGEATKFWLKLGFISFGGPAGQIAIMRQELVERRRWISEKRFLHALNYCMLLPGPEAQQLATYIGWLMHRKLGGFIAGGLFVLPGALLMMALAWAYVNFGNTSFMQSLLWGIKPAVVAIVAFAVYRIASKSLNHVLWWVIAISAFVAIAVFKIGFPWVVLGAAIAGWLVGKLHPDWIAGGHASTSSGAAHTRALIDDDTPTPSHAMFSLPRSLLLVAVFVTVALLVYLALPNTALKSMAQFFTQAALVTFGGAYAVLPYVTQASVEKFQWLTTAQMIDGLALGETTPGPLILILTFVGYLAGVKEAVAASPLASGIFAASVVTFYTFLPSFMMIFAGAPFIESTRKSLKLQAPLTGITAAVVGVIASLAVFFAQHTFWPTGLAGAIDWFEVALASAAFIALVKFKRGVIEAIAVCAVIGVIAKFIAS